MYYQLKKGEENQYFNDDIFGSFMDIIMEEIIKQLKLLKKPKQYFTGAFALHDIELKTGDVKNVWIEFNAKILDYGFVDAGIHELIIYDEIPDVILDRYNKMAEQIKGL